MQKNTLTIPSDLSQVHYWATRTLNKLVDSDMFYVNKEEFPPVIIKDIIGKRSGMICFFKINDVLMAIDAWDGDHPTSHLSKWFSENQFYSNTKIIFKIQYRHEASKDFKALTDGTGIIVSNWTMFHSNVFPLEYFSWDYSTPHKYLSYISGKRRAKWIDYYKSSIDVATFENIGLRKVAKGRPKVELDDYLELNKNCLWGLSLHGKRIGSMDCKNRREVEYASVKMPLVLNYKPEYPFPFEPNKHYFYAPNPEDLLKVKDIDPRPYSEAAWDTYCNYFSAKGSSKLLLSMLDNLNLLR